MTEATEDNASQTEEKEEDDEEEPPPIILPCTVPDNIVELKHSFGYDCKRLFNLCLIDADTLIFASGNLLHYYSISKNEFTLQRTVYGGGVGFIMKNHIPEYNYLTIAENGKEPTVFIYRYPDMEVVSKLKGGAVACFTTGVYSNNGELMATQAGYPDFMLTIWNWKDSQIVLRSKAYQNDVLNVAFSEFNPILLASCGFTHVQFWKMAQTFTGLKLKSDLGRFGKTDTCDVYAVYMLADEKVISGCEWGNMLVWEGGLIKFEVTRKARRPCHMNPITRIIWMGNNEVMTIGMDGYARIWFWETVELADPPEEDRFVEIDPIYEFRIGDKDEACESRHLVKASPNDDDDFEYYSQDGKGGVWLCDLNTVSNPKPPRKLFSCHGGRVVAGQASPVSSHIATFGEDGKVNIYNYETEELLIQEPFNAPGADLIWLDTSVDPSGMVLILGFENGVLRQVALEFDETQTPTVRFHLIFVIKPHATPITCLGVSPAGDVLVTCSLDNTAFLFHIKKTEESDYVELVALGFLLFEGSPLCMHWDTTQPRTSLFGCHTGEVYECVLPVPETIDLVKVRPTWRIHPISSKMLKFKSVKSRIRRDLEIAATLKRKARKLARKKKEIKRLLAINPGLQIDESALADSSEDEDDGKDKILYVPDPPNPVLWLQYTNRGTIWLSMGGYDSGYIYEVKFGEEEPVSCTLIPEADDVEIHSYMYIDTYIILGMQTGHIRINAVKPDFRDLSDYWLISMHDNLNGTIPRVFTSRDGKWFFSIGFDGNIFYYHWWGPLVERVCDPPTGFKPVEALVADIEDPKHLSLEEVKTQENLVKLRAFEEAERNRLKPSFAVMQMQVDWVTDKTKDQYQADLDAVLKKLKTDVTGACQDAQTLYDTMFLPLEYIPFEVWANNTDVICRTFRLNKLIKLESESFLEEMEEEGVIEEQSKTEDGGAESATTLAGAKLSRTHTGQAIMIYDFAEKVLLKFYIRILEFFTELKRIKREELEKVMELVGEDIDAYEEEHAAEEEGEEEQLGEEEEAENEEEEEDDMPLIERAIMFLNNSIRDNVEVKTLEISIIQEIIFHRKSEYNNKVIRLKDQKAKLHKKYEKLEHAFIEAEEEIKLPYLRQVVLYNEYPDEIFLEPFIPLRSFESILWEKPKKKTAAQLAAEAAMSEEEEAEAEDLMEESLEGEGEGEELPLEEEPSEEWLLEMEDVYDRVEERITTIDEELAVVAANRVRFEVELRYLNLLAEISDNELIILQDSELTEKLLTERDEMAKMERSEITEHIKQLKGEIDAIVKSFDVMNGDIKKIQVEFNEAVRGNKFIKFLKRIFEKKFKPQKERGPDDESESESSSEESSSDEEEEAGSGESGEMTAIALDESHCPPGCDRKLYDMAFELRVERFSLEQKIYDGHRLIENKKQEIDEYTWRIPAADELCEKEHTTLLIFRRQKDDKLHAVESAVIYNIEGFGLTIKDAPEEDPNNEYMKYLEDLLLAKKTQSNTLKEELILPTEAYMEKLKILLQILEERERLRRKKPSIIEAPPSEKSISIVSIVRPPTPPPPFDFEAYAAEKILKLVQRFFLRYLAKYIPEELMKKYIPKVARILGNIGRNFTCELADNIIEVLVENLQRIVPKKYLIHASLDDIRSLFKDIVAVFVMEPVEIDPILVITEAVEKGLKNFLRVKVANKTQKIILEICKVIVEELPMDEFRSPNTAKFMAKLLSREPVIIPNCLSTEILVEQVSVYAKEHMLSAVTVKIVRAFAEQLLKELVLRKEMEVRSAIPREKVCRDVRRKKRVA